MVLPDVIEFRGRTKVLELLVIVMTGESASTTRLLWQERLRLRGRLDA
jgi:hypothetical protein